MNASEGSVWQRKKSQNMDQIKGNKSYDQKKNKGRNTKEKYGLMRYEDLPDYMKDNEFILNYYRANWPIKQAFFSLFRWHNETLNVWTHLIGFALFVCLTVAHVIYVPQLADFFGIFPRAYDPMTVETNISNSSSKLINLNPSTPLTMNPNSPYGSVTRWPFFVFLSGSMFCLLSSSTCHLFCCHSHNLNIFLLRMDYVGIAVMIITSFFPPIYYIFQCDPIWQIVYLSVITAFGIFTIVTLLTPAFSSGKFRGFRALLFVAMGLFGIIPAIHSVVVNWDDPKRDVILAYEAGMALSYLIGTVFYVTRVPERWLPGRFDLAGHSHQIFHVFVMMGALAHYGAALIFLRYRGNIGCNTK